MEYTPIVNKLIRDVGLYPYIKEDTADWQERYVCKAFSEEIGGGEVRVLHREQSRLLGELLSGADIAVSAPTSFGKSFVIDAYISIKQPKTVVIIVPTIALMDETRRRISAKFSRKYKIITSAEQSLGDANILIFPQERAPSYFDKLKSIDLLVIDEFYKASKDFDKERSPALIRAILKFSEIATQRYFLAPNIDELIDDVITEGMEFLKLDFNTVW
ncbi:MAG: DEAD/DEAH box helicase [Methanosarcinales archaeon]|nr:DEAD/DEAH box helicase [Methanosarcinales archaeon]